VVAAVTVAVAGAAAAVVFVVFVKDRKSGWALLYFIHLTFSKPFDA
jgi:hypothetical protein